MMNTLINMMASPVVAGNTHSIILNGTNQYLSRPDANLSAGFPGKSGSGSSGDFSIQCWVKLSALPSVVAKSMVVASKYESAQQSYTAGIITTDKLMMYISSTSNGSVITRYEMDENFISGDIGAWINIVMTFNASAALVKFYKNAVVKTATAISTNATSVYLGTADFRIGRDVGSYFYGGMDDFRIYNRLLTATEIANNYQKQLTTYGANLPGNWKMNNNLLDATTNNNDLINNNSVIFSADVPY